MEQSVLHEARVYLWIANLVELAMLQTRVASDLGVGVGTLTMTVKSAHIYQTELGLMRGIIAAT